MLLRQYSVSKIAENDANASTDKGFLPFLEVILQRKSGRAGKKRLDLSEDPPPDLAVEIDIVISIKYETLTISLIVGALAEPAQGGHTAVCPPWAGSANAPTFVSFLF